MPSFGDKKSIIKILLSCFLLIFISSCQSDYIPKPRGYPRIILPETHSYQPHSDPSCPFGFEHPTYTTVLKDSLFFDKPTENPCWLDVIYPSFNARIHLSYKEINEEKAGFAKLVDDAYKLNTKHVIKANFINDSLVVNQHGASGLYYEIGGNAASSTQFFLTDSTDHFIWGSLYFKNTPNEDSIAPIVRFIRKDIEQLLTTFKWKK